MGDAGATLLASASFEEPVTIVRTRGFVSLRVASVAADVDIVGAIGVGIVSTEAFTAGIASVPEPFSDADWAGWYVWHAFAYRFEFSDASGFNFPNWSFEIDSKAMRKVGSNNTLVVVAESFGGAYNIASPLRTLVKLS